MKHPAKSLSAAALAVLLSSLSFAASTNEMVEMSLDDLLQTKISVATKKAMTTRETPSIVSLITREDIVNSGAHDLQEILTLFVPGVNFGADVEGVVGMGMRGLWGHEGKILLLIDGQECNEEQFATNQFGKRYSAATIERIEVIRGPGSAIYGGYAGLGVINVITKGAAQNGGEASVLYSQMQKTYAQREVAFSYGRKNENLSYSVSGSLSQGNRSDRDNIDINGNSLTMNGNSRLDDGTANINVNYRNLDVRVIADQYRTTQIDLWGGNYTGGALKENFDSYFFDVKYDFDRIGGHNLKITPEVKYKIQYPWNVQVPDQSYTNDKRAEKLQLGVSSDWDITSRVNMVAGVEKYYTSLYMPPQASPFEEKFASGENLVSYSNFGTYAQFIMMSDIANLTVGGRYDDSDEYGTSFVPRVGLTKVWGDWHAKLMYAKSFRTPGGIIPNRIPAGYNGVTPEQSNSYELELGKVLSETMYLVFNLFDMSFDKVIVYQPDPLTGVGSYFNSGKFGTRGAEASYHYEGKKASLNCNYAYYYVSDNNVDLYKVPGNDSYFLAFPQHRFNLVAGYKFSERVGVYPSLSYFGKRFGYAYDAAQGSAALKEFDPTVVANINVRIRQAWTKGLEINTGIQDVFDSRYDYIQPYNAGHAPLPAPTRSVYVNLAYKF